MQIVNTGGGTKILPCGTEVPGNSMASIDDAAWEKHKANKVVASWIGKGILKELPAPAPKVPEPTLAPAAPPKLKADQAAAEKAEKAKASADAKAAKAKADAEAKAVAEKAAG